ncbi:MAG: lipoyl synthase [Nitrospirae bacterium]|nr:lipoyl synthase [Nitrospirota bacterium]
MKSIRSRHPEWIKVRLSGTHPTKKILREHGVSTVCEEARCPNRGECFSGSTATFMILGDRCTRNCSFCSVNSAAPYPVDHDEPKRVADAARALGLRFVVVTSVTRDDLPDGGAAHFAATVRELKKSGEAIKIEVLTPDFKGNLESLKAVLDSCPDVFNHNLETVPRLYEDVRQKADYLTSLNVIKSAKIIRPGILTKSGIMLGLGEKKEEIISVMDDLRNADCDFLTIGQYLRPQRENTPVVEYITPELFGEYRDIALVKGFKAVASSPLTRSSMHAGEMFMSRKGGY